MSSGIRTDLFVMGALEGGGPQRASHLRVARMLRHLCGHHFQERVSIRYLRATGKGLGSAPAFADAVINAFNIGAVDLKALTNTGSERPFGVAADQIKSIKFSEPSVNGGKTVTLSSLDTDADLADSQKNPTAVAFPVGAFKLTLV